MHPKCAVDLNICPKKGGWFDRFWLWLVPLCKLHPAPTSAQDGLDPLQQSLVAFFFIIKQRKKITCTRGGHHLQLALVVFLYTMPTCPFTGVHKHIWVRIATCTVWCCLWFVVVVVVCLYLCVCVCVFVCVHAVCLWCCHVLCVCACVCAWGKQAIMKNEKWRQVNREKDDRCAYEWIWTHSFLLVNQLC